MSQKKQKGCATFGITGVAESLYINAKFRESYESFAKIESAKSRQRTSGMVDKRVCRANILKNSQEKLPLINFSIVQSPRDSHHDFLETSMESKTNPANRQFEIELISQRSSLENLDT
jgi:hypothetical protein